MPALRKGPAVKQEGLRGWSSLANEAAQDQARRSGVPTCQPSVQVVSCHER